MQRKSTSPAKRSVNLATGFSDESLVWLAGAGHRKKNASEDPANVLYPIAGKISQFQSIGARSIAVLTQRSDEPEDTERRAHQMGLRLIDRSNFDRLTAAYLDNREDVLAFELKKAFGWHQ